MELDQLPESSGTTSRFAHPLAITWRHKGLVLLGIVAGCVLGALYYSQKEPTYQSTAQVLVVKKLAAIPLGSNGTSFQPAYVEDYLATHSILLRSELIIRRAVKELEKSAPEVLPPDGNAAGFIADGLTVARETKDSTTAAPSNVLNVTFRGPNAADCPKVVNAIIQAYKDFLNETFGNLNQTYIEQLEKAQHLLDDDIKKKKEAYDAITQRNPYAVKAKDLLTVLQERINRLESKRADLVLRQAEIETSRNTITAALKRGTPRAHIMRTVERGSANKGINNTIAAPRGLEDTLATMLAQEAELSAEVGKDHPQLVSLRRRIQFLRDRISTEASSGAELTDPLEVHLQALAYELEETESLQKAIAAILEEDRKQAKETASFLLEEEAARQAIEHPQRLFKELVDRLTQIRAAGDNGGYNANTIVDAKPGYKVAPSLFQTLILAIMGGGMVGVGLAYLAEWTDKSFRTPEEIRQRLGVPVIGHVPFLPTSEGAEQAPVDGHMRALLDPRSREAEAIRGLRTSLYFSTQGRGHQVLQMTSPNRGDGKSTLLANLAVSIAQSGKSVVLIDADFRRPMVHKLFRLGDSPAGLASVLTGQAELLDAVRPCEFVPGLSLVPCGPRPANPAELLTSLRFQEMLAVLREKFDFVLVDTPPLLAVTDPSVVAPRVDGVILTLRMSKKIRPLAERAREILASVGANVIGVVVNGTEGIGPQYGYSYGYSYSYKYAYSYESYEEAEGAAAS